MSVIRYQCRRSCLGGNPPNGNTLLELNWLLLLLTRLGEERYMPLLVKVLFVVVVDSLSARLSSFFSDVGNALSRSELLNAIMQQPCYRGGYRGLLKLPHCTTIKI